MLIINYFSTIQRSKIILASSQIRWFLQKKNIKWPVSWKSITLDVLYWQLFLAKLVTQYKINNCLFQKVQTRMVTRISTLLLAFKFILETDLLNSFKLKTNVILIIKEKVKLLKELKNKCYNYRIGMQGWKLQNFWKKFPVIKSMLKEQLLSFLLEPLINRRKRFFVTSFCNKFEYCCKFNQETFFKDFFYRSF